MRNKAGTKADLLFQTSDTVWQVYNNYGGTSTYGDMDGNVTIRRSYKASYNRPMMTRKHRACNMLWGSEYPMIRWLEQNGYDVAYQSGIDTDRLGVENLLNHKIFLSVGHDEYWSGVQRSNVEQARD